MLIVICKPGPDLTDRLGDRPVASMQTGLDVDYDIGDHVWVPLFGDAVIIRVQRPFGCEPAAKAVLTG